MSLSTLNIKKGGKLCGNRKVTWSNILKVLDKAFCKNFHALTFHANEKGALTVFHSSLKHGDVDLIEHEVKLLQARFAKSF